VWIDGTRYEDGVTLQANASVTVDLNRPCTTYDALAGVDDLTLGAGAVRFSVLGDGVRLWRSGPVRRGESPVPIRVPLSGVRTVRLVVEAESVLNAVAQADWARPRLTCN
jgi:hypothetical protein